MHFLRSIFVLICVCIMLYDVYAKIVWDCLVLVGILTHCVLKSSLDGEGGISTKSTPEWAQVPKRASHMIR